MDEAANTNIILLRVNKLLSGIHHTRPVATHATGQLFHFWTVVLIPHGTHWVRISVSLCLLSVHSVTIPLGLLPRHLCTVVGKGEFHLLT